MQATIRLSTDYSYKTVYEERWELPLSRRAPVKAIFEKVQAKLNERGKKEILLAVTPTPDSWDTFRYLIGRPGN